MKITISLNDDKTVASISSPYNSDFVRRIKSIGGARWNGSNKTWDIPADCIEQARKIMREIYGECDIPETDRVAVELCFEKEYEGNIREPVYILGKEIANTYSRDGNINVGDDAVFIHGMPQTGGSRAYYKIIIPEGSIVRIRNVSKRFLNEPLPEGVICKRISETIDQTRENLIREKEKLLKRIKEIDEILGKDNNT